MVMEFRVRSQKGSRANKKKVTNPTHKSTNILNVTEPVVNSSTIVITTREELTLTAVS
jgi:hypothetical protein